MINRVCNKQGLCDKEHNFNISAFFLVLMRKLFKLKVLAIMTLSEATLIRVVQGFPNYSFPES